MSPSCPRTFSLLVAFAVNVLKPCTPCKLQMVLFQHHPTGTICCIQVSTCNCANETGPPQMYKQQRLVTDPCNTLDQHRWTCTNALVTNQRMFTCACTETLDSTYASQGIRSKSCGSMHSTFNQSGCNSASTCIAVQKQQTCKHRNNHKACDHTLNICTLSVCQVLHNIIFSVRLAKSLHSLCFCLVIFVIIILMLSIL